jgi:hypothetical protein
MKEYFYVASLRVLKELLTDVPFLYHETLTDDERTLSFRLFNRGHSVTQRIENLLKSHDRIMNLRIDPLFKSSFLQLQSVQFEYLSDEITNIVQGIMTLADYREGTDRGELHMYCDLIRELVIEIKRQLKSHAREGVSNLRALTKLQISICRLEYSHPVEFIILDWFVNTKIQAVPRRIFGPSTFERPETPTSRNILSEEVQYLVSGKLIEN